jgi:tetratricopeptide (TPR) repeat protein
VVEPSAESRIRDLERRLELDPGSRLFVALAEEYRKKGRLSDSLSALQKGLLAHPSYVSAQVALGRVYLEAGQITEAIATFSKVLLADPGNLVSAKSLADLYYSRGESVEAVKKYKLYRALSGDRSVDELVAKIEKEFAPPPPVARKAMTAAAPPPPPPSFLEPSVQPVRPLPAGREAAPLVDPFDITSVPFEPIGERTDSGVEEPFPVASRDLPLETAPRPPQAAEDEAVTRAIPTSPPPPPPPVAPPREAAERTEPGLSGRTLADLYFAQGHYAEALRIYDELAAAKPFDEEVKRLRRDAEARLLPAGSSSEAARSDPALERRLAKIRALKQWLSMLQTG